jgi:metal-sulfur cluster biosynthetic enzyme
MIEAVKRAVLVFTTQACPIVRHLTEQVRRRVEGLPGIAQVEVKVLDEPWNWDHFVRAAEGEGLDMAAITKRFIL